MQKKSQYCKTSAYCDDSKILIKSLNDQIDFLKSEIKSKNAIFKKILDAHENEMGQSKPFSNRRENNTGNITTKTKVPTTVISGDSILKDLYENTISKAAKFKKHIVVKHFSGAKVDNMKHETYPRKITCSNKFSY